MPKAEAAMRYIDKMKSVLTGAADRVWELAELALHEEQSAAVLAGILEDEGFKVEMGVAGMPSAFVATWGSGRPVVGFLGEYDALAGLSQKAIPVREELLPGAPGHGCGHNLLGVGALGGAIGLKQEMEKRQINGTIKYFGCPAEENLSGKAFMARDGLFDDCDVCLTWHPGMLNRVTTGSTLANNAVNITFLGRTAHAAGDPYNGRSALDAVQLMNLGVEFLREHMPPKARIHYVIKDGGLQPNVVPARATVWYLVRAPRRDQVDELYERVLNCARGAALMTDTRCEIELLKAIWEVLPNKPLEDLLDDCMKRVGPPRFGQYEREFAAEIAKSFAPGQREEALRREHLTPDERKLLSQQLLNDTLVSRPTVEAEPLGSTDVGDVSWCCPTAQFTTACGVIGTPGHSWQFVAQCGMGIGHAGMITAAKVLAEAGFELMTDPQILRAARQYFEEATGGKKYKSAMPPGHKPAFHQFAGK